MFGYLGIHLVSVHTTYKHKIMNDMISDLNPTDYFQVLSKWLIKYPDIIQTGSATVDGVLTVLLSTTILVGGALGCFLDNIIPGMFFTINFKLINNNNCIIWELFIYIVNGLADDLDFYICCRRLLINFFLCFIWRSLIVFEIFNNKSLMCVYDENVIF